MKKRIAIIGASYLQLPLIKKAKSMGIETHVFAWKAGDVGEEVADFFYPISIVEKEKILNICKDVQIDGICSIASDLAYITVNYVANKLGLTCNDFESTSICTNKYLMRLAFKANGDPCPGFFLADSNTDIFDFSMQYPIIVKPTDRSGSRGVYKIYNPDCLKASIEKAIGESFEKKAIVEEFVGGDEYSVECISFKGKHHLLAITQKFTTGEPSYIETGHLEPAPLNCETSKKINEVVFHALDSLKIKNGASHSEIKIDNNGKITIIEIGARMGGDCIGSDLVFYSTGVDFVKCVIQVALGEEPDLSVCVEPFSVKSVFLFNKKDFDELHRIEKEEPDKLIKIVDYHPERIGQTTDSSNRCGCYIVRN